MYGCPDLLNKIVMADPAATSTSETTTPLDIQFAQRALMEADRVMLQFVQTSLSMIAMGVSIYSFFTDVAVNGHEDRIARQLGLSLLILGLAVLATGTLSQARYRFGLMSYERSLRSNYSAFIPQTYYTAPTFLAAVALLVIGTVTLILILRN
jgi:uncharacterized membrane protein YidH (DUF202 family)